MNQDKLVKVMNAGMQKLKERHANAELDLALAHGQIEVLQTDLNELANKYEKLQKQHNELLEKQKTKENITEPEGAE
jgi:chromosome segregation ATPase